MGGFAYFYFGQATQVLITGNLNEASSITGFIFIKIGSFSLSINQAITVLVAMSAYTTIPALVYVIAELLVDIARGEYATHTPGFGDLVMRTIVLALGYLVAITALSLLTLAEHECFGMFFCKYKSFKGYNLLASVESIVGGVCSVSISLLLPSLFYFTLYIKEMSLSSELVVLSTIVFGAICVVGISTRNVLQLVENGEGG